jgi:hypothetical protein
MLTATALFALGPWLRRRLRPGRPGPARALGELVTAAYGGYFGAGLGILLMAVLTLGGEDDPRRANALKNLLASAATSAGVLLFLVAGAVSWRHALPTLAGAILGGVLGGRLAGRLPAPLLRGIVLATGTVLTAVFFWRQYA